MGKGQTALLKVQRVQFFIFAANNHIEDETFKAEYQKVMKRDLPSKAEWKEFLEVVKEKRNEAPYVDFLKDIKLDDKLAKEGTITTPKVVWTDQS
jgi:hypothetical protein